MKLNAVAHDSYAVMYAYVRQPSTKKPLHRLDADPFFSKYHPKDEALSTLLESCSKDATMNGAKRGYTSSGAPGAARERAPRLFDVIRELNLRTVTALQAHAEREASEGRTALAELCTKHGAKLRGYLRGALAVLDAPSRLAEEGMTKLDKLRRAAADVACVCGGLWQTGALRILSLNEIDPDEFCVAVCRALRIGARRGVNLGCVGAAGCGKSTLLEPFEFIFNTLGKPQKGSTFPLGNLPGCDLVLWQDYEHDEDTLCFTDLLSLFVGESVELRTPGELNQKHRNKAPLFYSGRVPLRCTRRDKAAETVLNGMMEERFATFEFAVPLPKRERKADWTHCAKCCASFYLRGDAAATTGATPAAVPGTPGPATTATATCAASFGVATGLLAVGTDLVAELAKLHALHLGGALSTEEFASAKRLLLGL